MAKNREELKSESMEVKKTHKVNIALVFDRDFEGKEYQAGSIILHGETIEGVSADQINKALQLNQLKAYPVE